MEFKYYALKDTRRKNRRLLVRCQVPSLPFEPFKNKLAYRTIDAQGNNLVLLEDDLKHYKEITEDQFYKSKRES